MIIVEPPRHEPVDRDKLSFHTGYVHSLSAVQMILWVSWCDLTRASMRARAMRPWHASVTSSTALLCAIGQQYMIKLLSVQSSLLASHWGAVRTRANQRFVRRSISSMSKLYPILDLQGQTVLITGETLHTTYRIH